jgi:hypothetical protein
MKQGRAATDKKDWGAATKAFTAALTAIPDNPEALAERGYAELLAKDYAAARKDLQAALAHSVSAKQEGMIWYNLALLDEAQGNSDAARKDYAESNRLRPSKAAADKLAKLGGATCEASIDSKPPAGDSYDGWVAAATGLAKVAQWADKDAKPPATEAEAKKLLCGDDACSGKGPWIVATADDVDDRSYHLVIRVGKKLVAYHDLGEHMAGRCADDDHVDIATDLKTRVHVTVEEEPQDLVFVQTGKHDELETCDSGDCSEACFYQSQTDHDLFFDPATGKELLEVTRPRASDPKDDFKVDESFTQPVSITVAEDGVKLAGGGCDQQVKF